MTARRPAGWDAYAAERAASAALSAADRSALAPWTCDRCGAILLTADVGPHYRTVHPDDAPAVTRRPACAQCGAVLSPVAAMLGPVCGACVRANHRTVAS